MSPQAAIDNRRRQMIKAMEWSSLLFIGFLIVTHQVVINGPLVHLDAIIANADRPKFSAITNFS